MDKTKHRMSKIVGMARSGIGKVGRAACVCAAFWGAASHVLADADKAAPTGSGLGLGGSYLFGVAAGLVMFGALYAMDVRKAHLAVYGK